MAETALAGLKILEYCQMISGPYCGKLLADLGAEVIKVEQPPVGEYPHQVGQRFYFVEYVRRNQHRAPLRPQFRDVLT